MVQSSCVTGRNPCFSMRSSIKMSARIYSKETLQSKRKAHAVLQCLMSSTAEEEVLLEKVQDKGVITLNRTKALNALSLNMIRRMYSRLKEWSCDPSMSMVIIKSAGGKAFCAGGDIKAVTESGKAGDRFYKDFFREEFTLNNAIGTLKIPWIAMIHGLTMGAGAGLSVHGRYRVATEKTVFSMPETSIGFFPGIGCGYFLSHLHGNLGLFLALTGFRLKGKDVEKAGVATHCVQSNQMSDLEHELLSLKRPSPQVIDSVLQKYQDQSKSEADPPFVLDPQLEKIKRLFGGKTLEEIVSNLEKEGCDWCKQQAETLAKLSPTSLKVTLRQLQQGKYMNLQDVLQMEYRLSQRFFEDRDFYEGVRAVLEKDKPQWDPSTLAGVTQDKLDWYFSPLPADRELYL